MNRRRQVVIRAAVMEDGPVSWGRSPTPVGAGVVAWSASGIRFLTCGPVEPADAACWCSGPRDPAGARALLARVFDPADVGPFTVCATGTAFQIAVWRALCAIPAGQVRSYGQIAAAIGRPRAVRAVGSACGANPVAVLVPCHRVIAGDGGLGGYSGGLDVKRRLLGLEGRPVSA